MSPALRRAIGLEDGGFGWEQLLARRRVVILAEAGSGKSTEMAARASLAAVSGQFAFKATVEDVGRDGLEGALPLADHGKLADWRKSADDAWFFIDSVDEAKLNGVRFEKAVRRIADGIRSADERAHVVFSGRTTDWEVQRDVKTFNDWLPIQVRNSEPDLSPEEELLRVVGQIKQKKKEVASSEKPLVVLMAPLDRARVRLFAEAKGISNVNVFLSEIESADLWHFALRPLDLDWLVRFWQSAGRLGSLAEMISQSVSERLKETNTNRARNDRLDSSRAIQAAERIGAALVFGRKGTIAIPDTGFSFTSDSPLDLADVLPDWSTDERNLLLSRPIFDPATLGRARFHGDNEGAVRSYLTAKWLIRLRKANLSTSSLFDLLFATSYGLNVVKPSLSATVGWLALWDKDVERELLGRSPSLLLSEGDPASLSQEIRCKVLVSLLTELSSGEHEPLWFEDDKLRRFAQPDLGSVILSLWTDYHDHKDAASFLLRLIWLGALRNCASLAQDVTRNETLDPEIRSLAGAALISTGTVRAKEEFAKFILSGRATLPRKMVFGAMMDLFPDFIRMTDMLAVLAEVDVSDELDRLGLQWKGPHLVNKVNSSSDLQQLVDGLLTQLGGDLCEHAHDMPTKREEAYFPALLSAAVRLLEIAPLEIAPEQAIDAILKVSNRRTFDDANLNKAFSALHRTKARRRLGFWRVAETLLPSSQGLRKVEQLWQMNMLGYRAGLQLEDTEWLLEDGLEKEDPHRHLALTSAFQIYRETGMQPLTLKKIEAACDASEEVRQAFRAWMEMLSPSAQQLQMERESEERRSSIVSERFRRDQFYIDFIRDLRNDATRVNRLKMPLPTGPSSDLYELWKLLTAESGSRYAIDSVTPLEKMAGTEIADAVRLGLIGLWRLSSPLVSSKKDDSELNSTRISDFMGLAGVSLEAASQDTWAELLSREEATRAAEYSTIELNGFPRWLPGLAVSKPAEVRTVLSREILDELSRPDVTHYKILSKVAQADRRIAELFAPSLLTDLQERPQYPVSAIPNALQIIVKGIRPEDLPRFIKLGAEKFAMERDYSIAAQYLAAVFKFEPAKAMTALTAKLPLLTAAERAALINRFLSAALGDLFSGSVFDPGDVPNEILEQLVRLTFQSSRDSTARARPEGEVYRVDDHDHANRARTAVFNRFVETPGAATYHALLRLQNDSDCQISPLRLRALADRRALQDSESAPWNPSEVLAFEKSHETAPRTPKDLQTAILSRLADIQHDLLHGDFSQGQTLKALPKEVNVQNWVADRLSLKKGRSFSVEREPHVVDEKEPDIRVRAKASDSTVSIEIKVAEDLSLEKLEDALRVQLCGRYLRSKEGRYGILLLVHQNARPRGWEVTSTNTFLSFDEVLVRLSGQAALIAGAKSDSPQPEVFSLDVSTC